MPANDDIAVDFMSLRELAEALEDILKQLNTQLAALYDRTEKTVLTWDGKAREAFVTQLDRWDGDMRDLQARQAWLHEMVTTGHANYAAAHRAVLRGWGAA
ncbi:WXG100 family type VII secretion target [Streptomyces melanogenes]|uniref:WXG100 family type VII secretion target n=1 Tax=Streptomyces melanogenes TaxID=67326 RepID=A0ABZ1XDU1_9ACTN|nr:WXG100 family type VII secretion target [Streptomyces melanogenes]